jgi:bifunctional DNase/RNase
MLPVAPRAVERINDLKRFILSSFDEQREAAVPVQMVVKRLIMHDLQPQQVLFLREVEGERSFPIVIGKCEAQSIDSRIKGITFPRPLTHDLILGVIEQLGGEVQDIYINDLKEHTYYARLRIRFQGELLEVDARPSDAIAVAITAKVPIYVAEDVLEEASSSS